MKLNKKGEMFQQLGMLGASILAVTVVLVVAFLVIQQGQTQIADLVDSTTVNNETITWVNNTNVMFANRNLISATCVRVKNNGNTTVGPGNHEIGVGNYTCSANGFRLTNFGSGGDSINASVNVTYTFKAKDNAYNATQVLNSGIYSIVGWASLIVLTMIGALLLGIVALFVYKRYT